MPPAVAEITEHRSNVDGVEVFWRRGRARRGRSAGAVRARSADELRTIGVPFLERREGWRSTCRDSGARQSPADFDYSIAGYDRRPRARSSTPRGSTASRSSCTTGARSALATAQRLRDRLERLVLIDAVPLTARLSLAPHRPVCGARPVVGELVMGFDEQGRGLRRLAARGVRWPRPCPRTSLDRLDLEPLRPRHPAGDPASSIAQRRREVLERGRREPRRGSRCPALVLWGDATPTCPSRFAGRATPRRSAGEAQVRDRSRAPATGRGSTGPS